MEVGLYEHITYNETHDHLSNSIVSGVKKVFALPQALVQSE